MSFNAGGGGSSSVSASTDVALSNVADSHALVYDGGVGKWRNATIDKTDVGLANVDNTSDASKPVSSATQAALNAKAGLTHTHTVGDVTNLQTTLDSKAAALHTHASADITDFTEAAQDVIGSTLVAGTNVTLNYDDTANTLTLSATPGAGVTDLSTTTAASTVTVVSSTGNDAVIAAATGTDAGVLTAGDKAKLDGIAASATANSSDATLLSRVNHTGSQAISTVTGLQAAIDGKQPLDSDLTDIAGLSATNDDIIQRKAGAWTNRTPAQLKTDLVLAKGDVGLGNVDNTSDATKNSATATLTNKTLSGASNTLSNIPQSAVTNLTTDLAGKAASSHTHTRADVTDIGLKVVAQATAPADTSVIWVKTS